MRVETGPSLRSEGWEGRVRAGLTLDGEEHGLADVGAHAVAGLAEVVAHVLFQDVADQQRAVGQDLGAAGEGHRVVLLRAPAPWKEAAVRGAGARTGERASLVGLGWPGGRPDSLLVLI